MQFTIDEIKLKKLLKAAVAEVLQERRDLVRDIVADVVEDIGMVKAIRAGARSRTIAPSEVLILRKGR